MVARAKDGDGKPAQIVSGALAVIPEDVKTEMGRTDRLKRWIREASKGNAQAEPGSAAALRFSDNYVRTPDGQERPLLQYNKGQKSVGAIEGRAIVFATEKCYAP